MIKWCEPNILHWYNYSYQLQKEVCTVSIESLTYYYILLFELESSFYLLLLTFIRTHIQCNILTITICKINV